MTQKQNQAKPVLWLLYLFIILALASPVLATTKPIAGYVFQNDNSTIAENATVIVYVNTSLSDVNPCYTSPSVYSGNDGSFSTNLGNLKRNDNDGDCSGLWAANDSIWAEADGSTVVPTQQGNGSTSGDTVSSGTGLQYISNITLAEGPDITSPTVTLISPIDWYNSTNGDVDFIYNVTDNKTISNCSLLFNGTLNQTDTSITKNTNQTFALTLMGDGNYNWSVNCTDNSSNTNTSSFRMLNVSKIGNLTLTLITPTADTVFEEDLFTAFTVQVNCLRGRCGDVNVSLDPVSPQPPKELQEKGLWSSVLSFFKSLLSGNLITGMAAGALVPTTPTDPFWTNSSNPANASNFSCLSSMAEDTSCNITWYVNASGEVGTTREFFAYANSTTFTGMSNQSTALNITITEYTNPSVFALIPSAGTVFNVSNVIEIGANVTDDTNVSQVFANLTHPNSTIKTYEFSNTSQKYNTSFTIPYAIGQYTVTFIANDTRNNINSTETTTFNATDPAPPSVFDLIPLNGTSYNASDIIEIAANVTDDLAVDTVKVNITYPNSTISQQLLSQVASTLKYNLSFTIPNLLGEYTVLFIANDTSSNINTSEITIFVGYDGSAPAISGIVEVPTAPATYSSGQTYIFNATITDNLALSLITMQFAGTNYTTEITNDGSIFTFNRTDLAAGTYSYTWFANDTSSNLNSSPQSYTIDQASSSINLTLDSLNDNLTIEAGATANLTGTKSAGEGDIILYQDGTQINTHSSLVTNLTQYNSTGTYNLTLEYPSTQNYSSSRETHFLIVQDTTAPNVSSLTATPNNINQTQSTEINATITDIVGVETVLAQITLPNGTSLNQTMENTSSSYNLTYLTTSTHPIGTYTIRIFANDTSNNLNSSETTTFILNDITPPNVTALIPAPGTSATTNSTIELAANVTDNINVSSVSLNLTYPNGTLQTLSLTQVSSTDKYNTSFTIPALTGTYNLTYFANDTSNNLNSSETSDFTVQNNIYPSVTILTPLTDATFAQNSSILITATITDDISVSSAKVNITLPDDTIVQQNMSYHAADNVYNATFTQTSTAGTYSIRIIAQDNTNNINDTETRQFTVQGITVPVVTLISPADNQENQTSTTLNITFSCNATDNSRLSNLSLYLTNSSNQSFLLNQTTNISGTSAQSNWNLTLGTGTYTWNCLAYDNDSNPDWGNSNRTLTISAPPPPAAPSPEGGGDVITAPPKEEEPVEEPVEEAPPPKPVEEPVEEAPPEEPVEEVEEEPPKEPIEEPSEEEKPAPPKNLIGRAFAYLADITTDLTFYYFLALFLILLTLLIFFIRRRKRYPQIIVIYPEKLLKGKTFRPKVKLINDQYSCRLGIKGCLVPSGITHSPETLYRLCESKARIFDLRANRTKRLTLAIEDVSRLPPGSYSFAVLIKIIKGKRQDQVLSVVNDFEVILPEKKLLRLFLKLLSRKKERERLLKRSLKKEKRLSLEQQKACLRLRREELKLLRQRQELLLSLKEQQQLKRLLLKKVLIEEKIRQIHAQTKIKKELLTLDYQLQLQKELCPPSCKHHPLASRLSSLKTSPRLRLLSLRLKKINQKLKRI